MPKQNLAEDGTAAIIVESNSLFHCQPEELLEPRAVVDHARRAREGDDKLLGEPVQPGRELLDLVPRLRLAAVVEAELAHQGSQAAGEVRDELVAPRQTAQVALGPNEWYSRFDCG